MVRRQETWQRHRIECQWGSKRRNLGAWLAEAAFLMMYIYSGRSQSSGSEHEIINLDEGQDRVEALF